MPMYAGHMFIDHECNWTNAAYGQKVCVKIVKCIANLETCLYKISHQCIIFTNTFIYCMIITTVEYVIKSEISCIFECGC